MAERICPWWMGYFLLSPLRRLYHNPAKILAPYVRQGMHVLDVGPGMGFFTIPLVRYVAPAGRVYCIDVQKKMLTALKKRAQRANVIDRLDIRICSADSLGIDDLINKIDFILAFAVVHEIHVQENFFRELFDALKPKGLLLMSEPKNHVTEKSYKTSLAIAEESGFRIVDNPEIPKNHSVLMSK